MKQKNDEQVDLIKWKSTIGKIEFFKPFSEDELDVLLQRSTLLKFDEGQYITREAVREYSFYVILQGHAEVMKGKDSASKRRLAVLTIGACFGEIAVLIDVPRTASVRAATPTHVFRIEGEGVDKLPLEVKGKLFKQFAITLAERLQRASQ